MNRFLISSGLLLLPVLGCSEQQSARESVACTREGWCLSACAEVGSTSRSIVVTDGSSRTELRRRQIGTGRTARWPGWRLPSRLPINAAALSRKIIYDGEVDLIVKDVDPVGKQVVTLVQDARGYIAEQSTTGSPGSQRAMRWKLRVPVEQFESTVQKVLALGELERNTRTSQDVTEQFYDIEARIKNKKAEEKSLTKILDERTGKLEDVLKIETELSRVRGEIEQLEGKIRAAREPVLAGHPDPEHPGAREIRAPAPGRGRLPDPGRPDLGELAARPDQPRESLRPLGGGLGALDPAPDRRRPARLDPPPLADPAPPPADRPGQHADHAATDAGRGLATSDASRLAR